VTIAGTGVSVMACGNQEVEGCKVATWTGLLDHGVKHCKDIGKADEDDSRVTHEPDQEPKDSSPNPKIAARGFAGQICRTREKRKESRECFPGTTKPDVGGPPVGSGPAGTIRRAQIHLIGVPGTAPENPHLGSGST
jgi:hypothetical protein